MKKINIIETALRDAHQSQFATRMTTEQMLPILETMDQAGYYALEAWGGGATFDVCLRHLDENPWDRLRTIRKYVKNTKLQMLMRGQNILGYTHYSDDVVEAFIGRSIDNGMDIIRLFDALNDLRNLETSFKAIKKNTVVTPRAPSATPSAPPSTPLNTSRKSPLTLSQWARIPSASKTWPAFSPPRNRR